ncbi:hypothetical protein OTB20_27700 [Streptomyces sp. H27-H1]|uniref:hypothetical protein n=1 Tax=Streptomyces sp. H27-H1 TaxID=2996461 RepID=UPI002270F7F3|nr:hypothetical protein [Streptomyces sp. H27-H1]MCY0929908.1 hypothetical protein [Streptomyces sp. H27-H1]
MDPDRWDVRSYARPLDQQTGGADYRPYLTTPYSTGYITPDRKYHTLMAYSSACGGPCSAVNQYANTENTGDGQPLGDACNNNAAVARVTTPIISGSCGRPRWWWR